MACDSTIGQALDLEHAFGRRPAGPLPFADSLVGDVHFGRHLADATRRFNGASNRIGFHENGH